MKHIKVQEEELILFINGVIKQQSNMI